MITLDIRDYNDVLAVKHAIMNDEDFILGEIKPLKFKVKIDGGRFTNYDVNYIDAEIAKIILSHQENYTKLVNELERKFDITFDDQDKILKFKLESGSLEFISELLNLGVLKEMQSKHKMYALLGIAGMWFSYSAYTASLEQEIKIVDTNKEIKIKELEGEDKARYERMANKTIDTFKELLLDKKLQEAINTPKKETLALLKENEKVVNNSTDFTNTDSTKFEYIRPNIEDEEIILENETVTLENYNFVRDGKLFKIKGITPLANSSIISAEKRMRLISKAETKQDVVLKIKIIKDGVTKKSKEAYIMDYIE